MRACLLKSLSGEIASMAIVRFFDAIAFRGSYRAVVDSPL
jgi:hypothetical protein